MTFHRTLFAERVRNRSRLLLFPTLDISIRSGDIRDRSLKLFELDPNFARFWPLLFIGYHAEEPSDRVTKFRGDRPTELGDLAFKKREERNISSKT